MTTPIRPSPNYPLNITEYNNTTTNKKLKNQLNLTSF